MGVPGKIGTCSNARLTTFLLQLTIPPKRFHLAIDDHHRHARRIGEVYVAADDYPRFFLRIHSSSQVLLRTGQRILPASVVLRMFNIPVRYDLDTWRVFIDEAATVIAIRLSGPEHPSHWIDTCYACLVV